MKKIYILLLIVLTSGGVFSQNNAQFVSQNVPTTVVAGDTFNVELVFKNNGTTTWMNVNPNGYFLGSQNPQDNYTWGTNRIYLSDTVAVGEQITLSATLTAPNTAGTYNFQWQMLQDGVEWFGDFSDNLVIEVVNYQNNAQFISQTVPNTVDTNQLFNISITFKNTGTSTWQSSDGFKIGSQNPQDNSNWGTGRIYLPNDVAPNEQVTINTNLTAPAVSGIYNFQWKMLQEGVEWFGEPTENTQILVLESGNSAVFLSQSIPSSVSPNETFNVSMSFINIGGTTWENTNNYKLGSQSPQDNIIWGTNRVSLPDTVEPGDTVNISFSLTAPATEGIYDFQWQMLQEGVEWFGAKSDLFAISVVNNPVVVDASTLNNKLMFGYQGWFTSPDDGSSTEPWRHYFSGGNNQLPVVDFWPDISEFDDNELFDTGLILPDGSPAKVPSAYTMKTVKRHMKWLADYQLDGIFLQRFVNELEDPAYKDFRDKVLENVRLGCEDYGRTFAVMYDISSSADINRFTRIKQDWKELVDLGKIDSPNYLKHNGLPVVSIWGIGFNHFGYHYTPAEAADLIDFFQNNPNPAYRATVMGGVPTYWRERINDSETDSEWQQVYESLDIISPWSVNRYTDNQSADEFRANLVHPDKLYIDQLNSNGNNISYMPVIWPGFSWGNLQIVHGQTPVYNEVPRNGGEFFWKQAYNVIDENINMIYVAMFDEIDEGTAMFKCAPTQAELPDNNQFTGGQQFVPLNIDGDTLDSDFYLKLASCTQKVLRGEEPLTVEMPSCDIPTNSEKIIEDNSGFYLIKYEKYYKIYFEKPGNYIISINNIYGQKIFEKQLNINRFHIERINTNNYKKGIYFINVSDNKTVITNKFVP